MDVMEKSGKCEAHFESPYFKRERWALPLHLEKEPDGVNPYREEYLDEHYHRILQNKSKDVNVVYEGSPSRILRVLLISLGITIRPGSSTLLTMSVGSDLCVVPVLFCNAERHAGRSLQ